MTAGRVEPLGPSELEAVLRLHRSCLAESLAARFGPRALGAYYRSALASPDVCGLVFRAGEVLGFVFGTTDPEALRRHLLTHRRLAFLLAVTGGILRHPAVALPLVASLRGPSEGSFDAGAPELTYLAVAPEARGTGAGRLLVEAFGREMARLGAASYELSVRADNRRGVAFYRKLDFVERSTYVEAGRRFLRLRSPGPKDGDAVSTC